MSAGESAGVTHCLMSQWSDKKDYESVGFRPADISHSAMGAVAREIDQYFLTTISVFLLGVGSVLTFLVIASAPDYILVVYRDHEYVLYLLVSIYYTANLLGLILMLSSLGTFVAIEHRIQFGFVLMALCTLFIAAVPYICEASKWRMAAFLCSAGVLMGFLSAVLSTSLLSYASILPNAYLMTAVSGQSFSGILSSLIRITNKAAFDSDERGTQWSGVGCFVMTALIQLLAAVLFTLSQRSQFVQQHLFKYHAWRHSKFIFQNRFNETRSPPLLPPSSLPLPRTTHRDCSYFHADFVDAAVRSHRCHSNASLSDSTTSSSHTHLCDLPDNSMSELSINTATTNATTRVHHEPATAMYSKTRTKRLTSSVEPAMLALMMDRQKQKKCINVLRKIYKCLLSIFIGYSGTFLVFPSLVVGLQFNSSQLYWPHDWDAIVLYSIWSVFGWLGMYITNKLKHVVQFSYDNLWLFQLLWLCVMYALFYMIHQRIITNDLCTVMVTCATPFVLGFLIARTFGVLPDRVSVEQMETAQATIQLTVLIGIFCGAWTAYSISVLVW